MEDNAEYLKEKMKKYEKKIADLESIIKAHEKVEELAMHEKMDANDIIKAHESVEELSLWEKQAADKIIKAHENLEKFENLEQLEAKKFSDARERISKLTIIELTQRDMALHKILDVNKKISSFIGEENILDKILKNLAPIISAKRGILFFIVDNKIAPKSFINIKSKDLGGKSFTIPISVINKTFKTKESNIIINEKIKIDSTEKNISIITVPMIYENKYFGILYLDMISDEDNFKNLDLEIAQIFSSQAAITINNMEVYKKIKKQNSALLKLVNLRSNFMRHVTKELNAPIKEAIIKFKTLKKVIMGFDEKQQTDFNFLKEQLYKIDNTVNKILTLGELDKEVEELFSEKVNFIKIINDIIANHRHEIDERNIELIVDLPDELKSYIGNLYIIESIFDEMICNAILYNKNDGKLDIKGFKDGHYFKLEITDTGYGIKENNIKKIFKQFERTEDSEKLNPYGAGLGLSIAKNFIAQYGGDIKVKSEYGEGSIFTLSFLIH